MKKGKILINLIICFTFICGLAGCDSQKKLQKEGITVYYVSEDSCRLNTETYENTNKNGNKLVEELLNRLTENGDESKDKRAIPKETEVKGYDLVDGIAKIDFAENYYDLTAKRELLCRAAIVLTLIQIDDVDYVAFTVAGNPCIGKDGKYLNAMTASDFVDDLYKNNEQATSDFTLYFADEKGEFLKEYNLSNVKYGKKTKEEYIVSCLIEGPKKSGYLPTISPKVKVLSVVTSNNICYVNFDEKFLTEQSQKKSELVIYSIVNSLSELDDIHKVQISVKGESDVKYSGKISLSQPFIRNLDLIK